MINLITRQRSSLVRSRPHMRTVRNSFTNFSSSHTCATHTNTYIHIHTSPDTGSTQTLPKVYSTEYPNRRRGKKRKEEQSGGEGSRGREEVEVGHRLPRRDATHTHTHTRACAHQHGERLSKRIAPVTSSFRKWSLSRAHSSLSRTLSRGPPSSVEFGVKCESRELLARLILLVIFPEITRPLTLSLSRGQ